MTTYRGMDGFVSLGGYVNGLAHVQTAVGAGASQVSLIGPPLSGVLLAGDAFTVAGVAGTFTVTATVLASEHVLANVPFTPVAPAGGFAAGALVTIPSASIAQTRTWTATATFQVLETTVQRDLARTRRTGLVEWQGTFEALFDYGDPQQAALLERFTASKPDGSTAALSFTVSDEGPVTLYGAAVVQTLVITSPGEDLVTVAATFQSTNQLLAVTILGTGTAPLGGRYTEGFNEAGGPPLGVQYTEGFDA